MKKPLFQLSWVIAVLVLASLACNFSASTANIKSATLSNDPEGTEAMTVFAPEDTFYLVVDLANAPDDTTVKATWSVVSAEGADPNQMLDESELTSGDGVLTFNLSNDNLWPDGTYKVDVYLNGELERTVEFAVQS